MHNFSSAQNSVNSNGQTISNANYSFDHTLGEISSVTASNGSYAFTQGFNQPTYFGIAIRENDKNLGFRIYPNPTEDNLFVSYSGTESATVSVKITDIKGVEVLNETICTSQCKGVNLKTFSAGEYIVTLTVNNKINQYKIIKAK